MRKTFPVLLAATAIAELMIATTAYRTLKEAGMITESTVQ